VKQNVRVYSDQNVVTDAKVEIRSGDDWIDIRECVSGITWSPNVGEPSWITLRMVPATVDTSGFLSDETLEAFAEHLRARGYDVYAPTEAAA